MLFVLITGNPFVYRSLCNSIVYQYLKCDTIISQPTAPTIYVTNYPANMLDFLLLGAFPPTVLLVADSNQSWASITSTSPIITINRKQKGNYEVLAKKVQRAIGMGSSVVAYVSNAVSAKHDTDVPKVHKGMFAISKQLQVPITPIVFDRIRLSPIGTIFNKKFSIRIGRVHTVKSVDDSMKYVQSFFSDSLKEFKAN
jgi:hypothetical protein